VPHDVTLIPGDGIGPEVIEAARRVLEATGVQFEWDVQAAGTAALKREGTPLPASVVASIAERGLALKGPVATPSGAGFRSVNLELRDALGLYAGIRPCRTWTGAASPGGPIDVVVIRMTMEDLYAGIEFAAGAAATARLRKLVAEVTGKELPEDSGIALKPLSASRVRPVARLAIGFARQHGRRRLTAIHKATVMPETDGVFLRTARDIVEREAPDILFDDRLVDTACHDLVARPGAFDVLLTPVAYGDVLSDLCAALSGGLGLAPGANVGDDCAVFEAVPGTAPRHAGLNRANPLAMILSGAMLLRHAGEGDAADRIERAVARVLEDGSTLTYDLRKGRDHHGAAGTSDVADAVIAALQS
jgi:isocitrate dehydrogenase (NAD+)